MIKNNGIRFQLIEQLDKDVIIMLNNETFIKLISNCYTVSNNKFKNILYHADKLNEHKKTSMCVIIQEKSEDFSVQKK